MGKSPTRTGARVKREVPVLASTPGFEELKARGINTVDDLVHFMEQMGIYRLSIRAANPPVFYDGVPKSPVGKWEASITMVVQDSEWVRSGDRNSLQDALSIVLGVPIMMGEAAPPSAPAPIPAAVIDDGELLV